MEYENFLLMYVKKLPPNLINVIYNNVKRKLILIDAMNSKWRWLSHSHSHKKRKDSQETRVKLTVLRTYVYKQAILELILHYHAWKLKKSNSYRLIVERLFSFLCNFIIFISLSRCKYVRAKLCHDSLQLVEETQNSTISNFWWR